MAALGEHRLGVELHALDGQLAVPQRHDDARLAVWPVTSSSAGTRVRVDRQRVVAGGGERGRQPGEHALALVQDLAGLAVQQLGCADHHGRRRPPRSPGGRGRRRAAGCPLGGRAHHRHGHAGVRRRPRAGGEQHAGDVRGRRRSSTVDRVVAPDDAAARRAAPGTARGCRRSCRSCRRRAPGGRSAAPSCTRRGRALSRRRRSAGRGVLQVQRARRRPAPSTDGSSRTEKVRPKSSTACCRIADLRRGGQLGADRGGVCRSR